MERERKKEKSDKTRQDKSEEEYESKGTDRNARNKKGNKKQKQASKTKLKALRIRHICRLPHASLFSLCFCKHLLFIGTLNRHSIERVDART